MLQEALLKLAERIAAIYPGFNPDSATACETICRTGAAFALSNPPANLDFFSVWHCAAHHVQMAAWLLGSCCIDIATLRLCRCTYSVRKRAMRLCTSFRILSLHVGCMMCPVLRGISLQIAVDTL